MRCSLGCLPLLPLSGAADTDLSSRVADVTVFADRALVGRVGEADLPGGETTLVVPNLPDDLIDDSLQVQVEGSPGLVLLGNDLRREFLSGAANPRARELEDQIRKLDQ
ncbi:MAG: DUF4140 domain-containing protein, partial [Verrucomicrobia bacterium]|nr:DUF4140 domain-containing protein [Verrucomicrobiota bacterium]